MFITNNRASFLSVKEKFGKTSKVSKYYDHDDLQNIPLLFKSLLTAQTVINSHILTRIYFIFVKKMSWTKLESLSIPHLDLSEKIKKVVIK